MQESLRRQYLALLGIEQWLPRDQADAADTPTADAAPAVSAVAALQETPPAGVPAPRARLESLLAAPPPGVAEPPVAALPKVATAAAPAAGVVERLGCALLSPGDGLLLVALFVSPAAPGLSSAEHAMFVRLAGALAPGAAVPEPVGFTWPPAGIRLPGMDTPGAAADALSAVLQRHVREGARDLVMLGESALVATCAAACGLRVVAAPALAAMLADPARKRACWDLIAPLKRAPRA